MTEHVKPPSASDTDPYYILASSPLADERTRVLKHGDTFAVFDHYGDVKPTGLCEEGLYHEGTRFLSGFFLRLGRDRPLFLSSTIREDNDLLAVDLTNPDLARNGEVVVPRGTLHLSRTKFLWQGACYERLSLRNYGRSPIEMAFALHFEADFVDVFEVRGTVRQRRGEYLAGQVEDGAVALAYRGLDGVVRRTRLVFAPAPAALSSSEARFRLVLAPQAEAVVHWTVVCETDAIGGGRDSPSSAGKSHGTRSVPATFDEALTAATSALVSATADCCAVGSSNEPFNHWVNRTAADLYMMTTDTPQGPYPYAGIPWFSTPFGRDGILTALECLWLNPALARGVLAYLASTQATDTAPEQDAEPGKILHETRQGEMAALGEIPFGRYYGSVDATPLFVVLAGAYYERTADWSFVESIWPSVEAALGWIDTCGDGNGDGFVDYFRQSPTGLANQGWKDSHDAIFHADGSLATGPIALCEVQGYVYAARQAAAELAAVLGRSRQAQELIQQAHLLRERFEETFWCDDLQTYAMALDGDRRPCRVRTSNAGQCLLTGIAGADRARRVARTLLGTDSFSGWGIRTVAAGEARYNPMAYHNGSIWPHDNALIALGLARYGMNTEALQILTGLFDASLFFDLHRLPELFCGFTRRPGEGPTLYPVACAPQAWAAAAVFALLQACLGLSINAPARRISFRYPCLPPFLKELHIRNLRLADASIDLVLLRHDNDVGVNVLRRQGKVEVSVVK
jgi:glycogen debranching enzyme